MTRYRKKPVEVEAWQIGSDEPMPEWVESVENGERPYTFDVYACQQLFIARDTEWLVLCDDVPELLEVEEFEQTYEVVE